MFINCLWLIEQAWETVFNSFGIGGSIFTFGWIACPEWTASYSVPDANICILLVVLDRNHCEVSKTLWMMSVSITELIWQAKWKQEVRNLSPMKSPWYMNAVALPRGSTRCQPSIEWDFYDVVGVNESRISQVSGSQPFSDHVYSSW